MAPVNSAQLFSSRWLLDQALAAGFHLAGFAKPDPIPPEFLGEWVAAGMAADMDWMADRTAERLDVRELLPSAKTVIALACNYAHSASPEGSPVARYAQGRDYHATMKDRMRALRRALKAKHPEIETYGGVDHGPFMEKVWAARAGLGYVGRNGCFITERYGSYVVLAVLVLDAEVDAYASGPLEDRCGDCQLCLGSCPTEAIDDHRRVDARRCLSFQTIENDGQVDLSLRASFDNTVFGCDICQDVCPLNRKVLRLDDARFAPRAVASLGVRELAAMTQEQYDALVPGTPLARAKYDGLRRNALYALGAAKDRAARALMERLQGDPSEKVRDAATWALTALES
ncbi:MAG: tRNA epoxyqueuosine(34) reductase QueG [Myxococcaceae bacterium]